VSAPASRQMALDTGEAVRVAAAVERTANHVCHVRTRRHSAQGSRGFSRRRSCARVLTLRTRPSSESTAEVAVALPRPMTLEHGTQYDAGIMQGALVAWTRSPHHCHPMHRRIRRLALYAMLSAIIGTLSAGCHRSRAQTASAPPISPEGEHCWWAAYRTAVPPDSVAVRYSRAFASLGLSGAGWSHQADTAWAEGGPTGLSRPAGAGLYAARVVAYRRGDTTLVRPFVAVRPDGDVSGGSLSISFCGDASRAAQALTTAPPDEERDDSLPVWRRRPLR